MIWGSLGQVLEYNSGLSQGGASEAPPWLSNQWSTESGKSKTDEMRIVIFFLLAKQFLEL